MAWVDLAIDGGQRVSPADAYLRPVLQRPNLTVEADCLVTRLHVEHGRCTGVSYVRDGVPARAQAGGEVIVCAGAVGSPQLLMLSGIGPAGQLRALGIDPVADIAEVGENLHDHPVVKASYAAGSPLPRSKYNHGEVYAALRSPQAGAVPDLHLFPILLPLAPGAGYPPPAAGHVLVSAAMAPDSRGSVVLASPDPQEAPLIDPGFLRDGARPGPAGGGTADDPRGRGQCRVLARAHDRGVARPGRPHQRRPARLHPPHGRQLSPSGRHLPDGAGRQALSWTWSCAFAG